MKKIIHPSANKKPPDETNGGLGRGCSDSKDLRGTDYNTYDVLVVLLHLGILQLSAL